MIDAAEPHRPTGVIEVVNHHCSRDALRVVYVVFNPNDDGSMMSVTRRQVDWLTAHGIRVAVVANEAPRGWNVEDVHIVSPRPRILERTVTFAVNGVSRRVWEGFSRWDSGAYFTQRAFDAAASERLRDICSTKSIDVAICVQHFCAPGLKSLRDRFDVPFVVVAHGDIFSHPASSFPIPLTHLYRRSARIAYRGADHVVAVGSELRERAIEMGANPQRVTVIPNGLDASEIEGLVHDAAPRKYDLELLYVGRLAPEKGVETLLKAVAGWSHPNCRLRIVGDGPSAASLRDLARLSKSNIVVEFIGAVSRNALGSFYRASDIVVIPSLAEAHGVVALEVMCCGVPMIASRVGGLVDSIQDQVTGLLIPPADEASLRAAIHNLAESPARRATLSNNARNAATNNDWTARLDRFLQVIQGVRACRGAA